MLSEVSQTEKDKQHIISFICGIKKIKRNEQTKQMQTHRNNKLMLGRGEGVETRVDKGKGNIVSNNVVTLYSDRWSLDSIESLCCASETNINFIVCQLYFNTNFLNEVHNMDMD